MAGMRIGELARQSGVPASALRYYEQLGLLPEPTRTETGYRRYGAEAAERLAFIRAAQAVGLTLAEVRQVLGLRDAGGAPCRVVTDLIAHRHAEVKAKIGELRRLERELTELRARAAKLSPRDCDPSGICHVIPLARPSAASSPTPGARPVRPDDVSARALRSPLPTASASRPSRTRRPG